MVFLIYLLNYLFGHYNLLLVLASANLQRHTSRAFAAFLDYHQPIWPNAGEAILFCDFHQIDQIRKFCKLGWGYLYERHDSAIDEGVF